MNLIMFDDTGNDSFTKILLHFDGSSPGTTFTDTNAGGSAKTWTRIGTNFTSSAAPGPPFGTTAYYAEVASSCITTPDHADFTVGSGAWAVDFQMNRAAHSGQVGLFGQIASNLSTGSIVGSITTGNLVTCSAGGAQVTSTTSVTDSIYRHFAITSDGSTLRIFCAGVLEHSQSIGAVGDGTTPWTVGRFGDFTGIDTYLGRLKEFRLSVGHPRWTSNFSPPTVAYGPN